MDEWDRAGQDGGESIRRTEHIHRGDRVRRRSHAAPARAGYARPFPRLGRRDAPFPAQARASKERTFESTVVITLRERRRTSKAGKQRSPKHKKAKPASQADSERLPSQDKLATQAELPIGPDLDTSVRSTGSPSAQAHVQEVRPARKRVRSEAYKKRRREKQANLRAERDSLSQCRDCGKPRPEGQTRCHDCVMSHRRYWKTYATKGRGK